MIRNYSRYARLEEGRNIRSAYAFIALSIALLIILGVFGIPAATKIAGYIIDSKNKGAQNSYVDKTPPGPPFISQLPEGVNVQRIKIEGSAEPESTVIIFVNDEKDEVVSASDGSFSIDELLTKGQNTIYAKARDKAGNESADSQKFVVYFSKEKPDLTIDKPKDGNNFYGSKQQQIMIEGTSCVSCSITINDRIAIVDDNGNFKLNYQLGNGSNSLNFKSTDKAGNQTEETISVTFNP